MTKFHDNPSPRMEEQICGKVELPRSRARDSPKQAMKPQSLQEDNIHKIKHSDFIQNGLNHGIKYMYNQNLKFNYIK